MAGNEASEPLRVGSVHDGVRPKPRDIPAPQQEAAYGFRFTCLGDSALLQAPLQVSVLDAQVLIGDFRRWAHVHERAVEPVETLARRRLRAQVLVALVQ